MIAIRFLGAEEARDGDGRVVEALLRQPKRFALLAYLAAAEPVGFHRRDVLLSLLWPDADPQHARHALNQALYFLRHALGNDALVTRGAGDVALDTEVVSCDVWTFRQAIADGDFERAVAVYGGPLIGGFASGTSAAFEQWVDRERDKLSRSYAAALEHLAEACAERGERREEIGWWYRLAEHDPYSTYVRLRLMAALDAAGDRAGALEQAAKHAARLREDLHAEPSPDTSAFAQRLRQRPVSHGATETDTRTPVPPVVGQRYTIERELGGGGLATVYLAHDAKHGRPVALKVLRTEVVDALGAELFLREIKIVATLNHPHILPLLDSGEADGVVYYAMPYVDGESLRERLKQEHQLPIDDALTIAREVADALAFAHERGVLHRDVKPENILLEAGHAVVADFGVANAIARAGEAAHVDSLVGVGTPVYLSPEQAAGCPDLDGRSDLYSLGCVLHEMLTGRPPFTGSTMESLVEQHRTMEPPRATAIRPSVPGWLSAVLERSLAKNPADRFEGVVQFGEAITPRRVITPPWAVHVERRARRRWLRVGGAVVGVGAVVIAVIGSVVLLPRWRGAELDANRILVVALADESGLKETEALGRMAQTYIVDMLSEAGFAEVVDPLTTLVASQNVTEAGSAAGPGDVLALAKETRAGTVVSGDYYTEGDSIHFQTRISDASDGRILGTVGPVVGAIGARRELVGRLGQEVVAALAYLLDQDIGSWEPRVRPATYEAYAAYGEGLEAYLGAPVGAPDAEGYVEAARHFERAAAADPAFSRATVWAAQSYQLAGFFAPDGPYHAKAESLIAKAVESRAQLTRYEGCRLDFVMSLGPQLNSFAGYEAARCMAQAAPGSDDAKRELALSAKRVNRPAETVQRLGELDPDRGAMKLCRCYWPLITEAYHMLGEYERELEMARQAWQHLGESRGLEVPALAALGRLEDVAANLEAMRSLPDGSDSFMMRGYVYGEDRRNCWRTLGGYLGYVALVLRTHGHHDAARAVFDEAIAWYRSRSHDIEEPHTPLAWLLYQAERWGQALRLVEELVQEYPEDGGYVATLGKLAARRGAREEALRISEELCSSRPSLPERVCTLERARIAALVGDREDAVTLLRQAIEQGVNFGFGVWVHRDMDFESLRDYPPFQEFVRPKG